MTEIRYFNFPIIMLEGFLNDYRNSLTNICYYALYKFADDLPEGHIVNRLEQADQYYELHYHFMDERLLDILDVWHTWGAYDNYPHVGLNVDIFEDYLYNNKDDIEVLCLLGFLALKSIIGKNLYCKTNNKFLFARMAGKAKAEDYIHLPDEFKMYTKSRDTIIYYSSIIRFRLEQWHFVFYSNYTRGFYVSLKLNIDELALIAESQKKSNREKIRKRDQKAAHQKALQKLGIS